MGALFVMSCKESWQRCYPKPCVDTAFVFIFFTCSLVMCFYCHFMCPLCSCWQLTFLVDSHSCSLVLHFHFHFQLSLSRETQAGKRLRRNHLHLQIDYFWMFILNAPLFWYIKVGYTFEGGVWRLVYSAVPHFRWMHGCIFRPQTGWAQIIEWESPICMCLGSLPITGHGTRSADFLPPQSFPRVPCPWFAWPKN